MFTGLVEAQESILGLLQKEGAMQLRISHSFDDLTVGASIAVDGACLTVTEFDETAFTCALSSETLDKTIAKSYVVGRKVNVERAMKLSDRLGGHVVTGHVDAKVSVLSSELYGDFICFHLTGVSQDHHMLLVEKGSVAINGVSLTINALLENGFTVMLIPETLKKTNLSLLCTDDLVNIEFDYLAKIVCRHKEHSCHINK